MKDILLSDAQKFFLGQLHAFHCLTEAQARHILTVHGGAGERAVAPILRQLKSAGVIRRQDGVIIPDGGWVSRKRLLANDLLLGLLPNSLPALKDGTAPVLLTAVTDRQQILFIWTAAGAETEVCRFVEAHMAASHALPTVYALLLENAAQISNLTLSRSCLLAYYADGELAVEKYIPQPT